MNLKTPVGSFKFKTKKYPDKRGIFSN